MTDEDPNNAPEAEHRRDKRGADNLVVVSIFVGAILLLIALLFFAY